ncbi:pkn1 [Symbiodinium natans]|uniref:Pkn1 protein n=1 Tax=Symbiodinium natans TaxID=878477 RepID=A0A812TBB2_9DINO|nr:pkn1 [Symbiodinium natans]
MRCHAWKQGNTLNNCGSHQEEAEVEEKAGRNGTHEAPGWQESGRGPRLRQLFGGYRGQDIWGILRKTKSMEDGQGFLSFEESSPQPSMLFLWDIFSQQNANPATAFVGTKLGEARFLHAVFDASGRGLGREGSTHDLSGS